MYIQRVNEREFWNEAYLSQPELAMVPDHLIMREISDIPVGYALDLGCGSGANALALAARGWRITGVDWADEAVFLAERAAYDAGVTARFEVADAATWNGSDRFDLVISTFALPSGGAAAHVIRNAARRVAPGGTLLIAEWDRSMAEAWGHSPCTVHDPAAIAELLTGFVIATAEVRVVERMFDADDPRAVHGRWARVAVVKAVRSSDDPRSDR